MRALLVVAGSAVMAYGGWLLLSRQQPGQVREVVVWLAAAIVLHDVVLAPAVLLVGWLAGRHLPPPAARGGAVVLLLLGPLLLIAVPVLGRFGARADNPSLLDRDYAGGLAAAAVVCVLAGLAVAIGGLRSAQHRDPDGRQ